MVPVSSIEVLIVSKPVVWNLKMIMSYILFCGLGCKVISPTRISQEQSVIELFGFEVTDDLDLDEILSFCNFHNIDINLRPKKKKVCFWLPDRPYFFTPDPNFFIGIWEVEDTKVVRKCLNWIKMRIFADFLTQNSFF